MIYLQSYYYVCIIHLKFSRVPTLLAFLGVGKPCFFTKKGWEKGWESPLNTKFVPLKGCLYEKMDFGIFNINYSSVLLWM